MSERRFSSALENWCLCDSVIPAQEIIYITQIVLIYIVVICCIVNLTIGKEEQAAVWASLLSGALGYMLPAPSPGKRDKKPLNDVAVLSDPAQQL